MEPLIKNLPHARPFPLKTAAIVGLSGKHSQK